MQNITYLKLITRIILALGLFTAVVCVALGGVLDLIEFGHLNVNELLQDQAPIITISQILHLAFSFSSSGLIELGLYLLVVTQIFRIAPFVFFYMHEGDYKFSILSAFILFVLIYSLFWRI